MILHFLLFTGNLCQGRVKVVETSNDAIEESVKPRLKTIIHIPGKDNATSGHNKNQIKERVRKVEDDDGDLDGDTNKNKDQQIYVQSANMFAL